MPKRNLKNEKLKKKSNKNKKQQDQGYNNMTLMKFNHQM
jgi:hypothetical protein